MTFTDGRVLPCRTLIWTAGVAASPLIATLGAETVRGRLVVDSGDDRCPARDGVFALGDAAAVPDLAKGDGRDLPAHRAARHAPGPQAGRQRHRVAARPARCQPYEHKDLGLVVDLGGRDAVSKPLGIELSGLPAQVVARGYHWSALRTNVAKTRVHDQLGCSTRSPATTSYGPGSRPVSRPRCATSSTPTPISRRRRSASTPPARTSTAESHVPAPSPGLRRAGGGRSHVRRERTVSTVSASSARLSSR